MAILAPVQPDPDPFNAAADLVEALPSLTRLARIKLGITVQAQAKQIGIQTLTLTRLERGSEPVRDTILKILRWLAKVN